MYFISNCFYTFPVIKWKHFFISNGALFSSLFQTLISFLFYWKATFSLCDTSSCGRLHVSSPVIKVNIFSHSNKNWCWIGGFVTGTLILHIYFLFFGWFMFNTQANLGYIHILETSISTLKTVAFPNKSSISCNITTACLKVCIPFFVSA